MLTFTNRQPNILHLISPDSASPACLYANVKINIQAGAEGSGQNVYAAQNAKSNVAPMLTSCRPDDSPTFLHGRPEHVSFDLIFNKRPYLKDSDLENQDIQALWEAIKLRAATISLTDGVKSTFRLSPVNIYQSNKEYRTDEWHLGIVFDISEFEQSATEKLVYAQLHILEEKIVDDRGSTFVIEKRL